MKDVEFCLSQYLVSLDNFTVTLWIPGFNGNSSTAVPLTGVTGYSLPSTITVTFPSMSLGTITVIVVFLSSLPGTTSTLIS